MRISFRSRPLDTAHAVCAPAAPLPAKSCALSACPGARNHAIRGRSPASPIAQLSGRGLLFGIERTVGSRCHWSESPDPSPLPRRPRHTNRPARVVTRPARRPHLAARSLNHRSEINSLLTQCQRYDATADLAATRLDLGPASPQRVDRPRRQSRLTSTEAERLGRLYLAGTPIADLADTFRIHRTTVVEHITRLRLPYQPRKPKLSEDELPLAVERYRRGDLLREIAAAHGVHPQTLRRALRRSAHPDRGLPRARRPH